MANGSTTAQSLERKGSVGITEHYFADVRRGVRVAAICLWRHQIVSQSTCTALTPWDARKARARRGRGPTSSRAPGLVKGEASLRSGRQTEYRRKAGRRNNVDMGESVGRLDGRRGEPLDSQFL